jgi:hypothetical protein
MRQRDTERGESVLCGGVVVDIYIRFLGMHKTNEDDGVGT